MECPRCGALRVWLKAVVRDLRLEVWRCAECETEFTAQPADDRTRPIERRRPRLILNVDDHPPSLYIRNRILRASGFSVADATTGLAAWRAALQLRPSALLLDVHLPDGDGRELCRRFRGDAELGAIPVVLISATLFPTELADPAAWGAVAFLREPVTARLLATTMRQVANG